MEETPKTLGQIKLVRIRSTDLLLPHNDIPVKREQRSATTLGVAQAVEGVKFIRLIEQSRRDMNRVLCRETPTVLS